MNKKEILKAINNLCEPIAKEIGYDLVDVEFVKEGSSYFLRVYIDKPGGINLDDCQKMSELLSDKLDEVDPISVSYYLEVSSPGLDRPLKTDKDLKRNIGKDIEVKLYNNWNGKKIFVGILENFNEKEVIIMEEEMGEVNIPKESISIIRMAVKF